MQEEPLLLPISALICSVDGRARTALFCPAKHTHSGNYTGVPLSANTVILGVGLSLNFPYITGTVTVRSGALLSFTLANFLAIK